VKLWPATWWPREAWWRDPDDQVRVVGWGPFPLPGERKASRRRGEATRVIRAGGWVRATDAQTCRATTLPCCFSCPASICTLVDVHGAKEAPPEDQLPTPERECRCWPGGGVPFDSYCEGNGCRP
jgi:hypothetical protein